MATKLLTPDIKKQVEEIIEQFNQDNFPGKYPRYSVRFKGNNAYIDRTDMNENAFQICRLSYTGQMNKWGFAIYRHSSNRYDADEWFFPGSQCVDGSVQGALKAGLEAYPIITMPRFSLFRFLWAVSQVLWYMPRVLWVLLINRRR